MPRRPMQMDSSSLEQWASPSMETVTRCDYPTYQQEMLLVTMLALETSQMHQCALEMEMMLVASMSLEMKHESAFVLEMLLECKPVVEKLIGSWNQSCDIRQESVLCSRLHCVS